MLSRKNVPSSLAAPTPPQVSPNNARRKKATPFLDAAPNTTTTPAMTSTTESSTARSIDGKFDDANGDRHAAADNMTITPELRATLERSKLDVEATSQESMSAMLQSVQDVPEIHPATLGSNPMAFYDELSKLGEQYGAVKLVPPKHWCPPLSLQLDALQFHVNLQRLDRLVTGRAFQHSKALWDGRNFAAVASAFAAAVAAAPDPTAFADLRAFERSIPAEFLAHPAEDDDSADIGGNGVGPGGTRKASSSSDDDDSDEEEEDEEEFTPLAALQALAAQPPSPKRRPVSSFLQVAHAGEAANTPEREKYLECLYWRLVESQVVPLQVIYGSDIQVCRVGSCFPLSGSHVARSGPPTLCRWLLPTTELAAKLTGASPGREAGDAYAEDPFNLQNFAWTPGSLLQFAGQEVTGVTCPWLYIGMLFSSFCWHTEDDYWGACNYHHAGAAKVWYVVPSHAAPRLEAAMKQITTGRATPSVAIHGMTLQVPLTVLRRLGIPFYRVVQRTGEFILLWPRVFHAGFNLGLNVNEACNAAPPAWLRIAATAEENYRWLRPPCVPAAQLAIRAAAAACRENADSRIRAMLRDLVPHLRDLIGQTASWRQRLAVPARNLVVRAAELRAALAAAEPTDARAAAYLDEQLAILADPVLPSRNSKGKKEKPAVTETCKNAQDVAAAAAVDGGDERLTRLSARAALPYPECVACKAACYMATVTCEHGCSCVPCFEECAAAGRKTQGGRYSRVCPACDSQVLLFRFRHAELVELLRQATGMAAGEDEIGAEGGAAAAGTEEVVPEQTGKLPASVNLRCALTLTGKGSSDLATKASTNVLWQSIAKYVQQNNDDEESGGKASVA